MIIQNGLVFQEDGSYRIQDIYIERGKIVQKRETVSDPSVLDASGCKVLPGLIDIHSHGAVGCDFSDADADGLKKILQYEKSQGITTYCPTSMTLPLKQLLGIFKSVQRVNMDESCAHIAGVNMEGPFLDVAKKGAHLSEYIHAPNAAFFRECQKASNNQIKLLTLAPNVPGAFSFIEEFRSEVIISLGHTNADYDCSMQAIKLGAHHITHLYNAMTPLSHRDPGLPGAAGDCPDCMVELICDGIHIHPAMVRNTFHLFGPERIILISDSMRAAGMSDGTYELGGQTVYMKNRRAILADGTIAGSASNLFDCVRMAISMGISEADALLAATRNPAVSLGIFDTAGSVTPGKRADLVITDMDLKIRRVISSAC